MGTESGVSGVATRLRSFSAHPLPTNYWRVVAEFGCVQQNRKSWKIKCPGCKPRYLYSDRGTKNRRVRWVPVDEELEAWLAWRRTPEALAELGVDAFCTTLFPNPTAKNAERRWLITAVELEWQRACEKVGVRGVSVYPGTKHSRATQWLNEGATLEQIQAVLGHADRRSTEKYARISPLTLVGVVRKRQ